jgi:hypothetical protein
MRGEMLFIQKNCSRSCSILYHGGGLHKHEFLTKCSQAEDDSARIYDKLEQLSHHFQCLQSSPSAHFRGKKMAIWRVLHESVEMQLPNNIKETVNKCFFLKALNVQIIGFQLILLSGYCTIMSLKINKATKKTWNLCFHLKSCRLKPTTSSPPQTGTTIPSNFNEGSPNILYLKNDPKKIFF